VGRTSPGPSCQRANSYAAYGFAAANARVRALRNDMSGDDAFEVKWDGFRAILGRSGDFRVREDFQTPTGRSEPSVTVTP
jgi:hypothetical protein